MGLQSFFFHNIHHQFFNWTNIPFNTNKYSSETEVITKLTIDAVVANFFVVGDTTVIFTITKKLRVDTECAMKKNILILLVSITWILF